MSSTTNGQYVQIPDLPIAGKPNGSEWIEIIQIVDGVLKSYRMPVTSLLVLGKDGLSAYEVAQKNGYRGTEPEWLTSLNGKSAFDIVREIHPEIDTPEKFAEFITGPAGLSAYEAAKRIDPNIGSEAEWIASLYGAKGDKGEEGARGPKGDAGDPGERGLPGTQGAEGPQGYKGDKGDKGDAGSQGIQGIQGLQGIDGHKGDRGDVGAAGTDGANGTDGAIGPQGLKGDTGSPGAQGLQGLQGPKGEKGEPGTGGGGGGVLYWLEDAELTTRHASTRPIDPNNPYDGYESIDNCANVYWVPKGVAIANIPPDQRVERLNINLLPLLGGHLSISPQFISSKHDINLSERDAFYVMDDVGNGGVPIFYGNMSNGQWGHGTFLGGGRNIIGIGEDILIPEDGYSEYDSNVEKEAAYGATIIGGYRNEIYANRSIIVNSENAVIEYRPRVRSIDPVIGRLDKNYIANSTNILVDGGNTTVINSDDTTASATLIVEGMRPFQNSVVLIANDYKGRVASSARVVLNNTSHSNVFESSNVGIFNSDDTSIFASHNVAALNTRMAVAYGQNASVGSNNQTELDKAYHSTTMIGGMARSISPAEGPVVVFGGNKTIQSRLIHGAPADTGFDEAERFYANLKISYGGALPSDRYYSEFAKSTTDGSESYAAMDTNPSMYYTKVHISTGREGGHNNLPTMLEGVHFFELEYIAMKDRNDEVYLPLKSVRLRDLINGTVYSNYTGPNTAGWPIGLEITLSINPIPEFDPEAIPGVLDIVEILTATIRLSNLDNGEDTWVNHKVNYRADIVDADGCTQYNGVFKMY